MSTIDQRPATPLALERPSALKLLFWAFCAAVLLRIVLTDHLLNLWINYTTEEGSIVEKIHPGGYALSAVCLTTLLTQPIALGRRDLRVARALLALMAVIGALCALMAARGQAGSAGYLIDSYGTACLAGITLLAFPPAWRAALGGALLSLIVASAVVAVGEVALKTRLLPYPAEELSFRPTGLMGHPLSLGLVSASAIGFVAAFRWSSGAKAGAIALLLLGAAAAGARLAMLAAVAGILILVLMAEWRGVARERRIKLKALALIGAAAALPAVAAVLAALGLLDRFENGLLDDSAMARVDIYKVFGFVGWTDILFGGDIAAIRKIALDRFGLPFIESALVVFIVQFGFAGTVAFLGALTFAVRRLLSGAPWPAVLATLTFAGVALSNNTLASKTPTVLLVFLLIEASRCAAGRRAS